LQTSCPIKRTLTRGWIPTPHKYSFLIPYSSEKLFLKMIKTLGEMFYNNSTTPPQEDTLDPGIANTWELVRQHYKGPRL